MLVLLCVLVHTEAAVYGLSLPISNESMSSIQMLVSGTRSHAASAHRSTEGLGHAEYAHGDLGRISVLS